MTWMTMGDLSRFKFIGILERFEESIYKLGKIFNKKLRINVKRFKRFEHHVPFELLKYTLLQERREFRPLL